MKNGLELIRLSVHPTLIMSGYRLALKECIRYIRENLLISGDLITDEVLYNVAKASPAVSLYCRQLSARKSWELKLRSSLRWRLMQ